MCILVAMRNCIWLQHSNSFCTLELNVDLYTCLICYLGRAGGSAEYKNCVYEHGNVLPSISAPSGSTLPLFIFAL